jgi:hypothetical protein
VPKLCSSRAALRRPSPALNLPTFITDAHEGHKVWVAAPQQHVGLPIELPVVEAGLGKKEEEEE